MSSSELPADARAPKFDGPIYTASAPCVMAAMAVSAFFAGDSSSMMRGFVIM
ncbi:MAG: hypothetical protein L6U61_12765 [Bacteroidales bacterium]|nr:MAG: hypothetical protein L6U61_12765 [Bacteroidales bacterium]